SHPDGYLSAIQIYANDPEIAANFSDLEWWSTFVDGPSNDRRAIFLLRDTFVALKKDPNASLPRTMDELKEAALQNAGKYAEEYRQRLISQAENRRQDKERRLLKAVFVEASSNTESFQKFMAAFIPVVRENDVPDPNYVKNTQDAFALQPSVSEAALVTAVAENNEWLAICKASANWERELNADEDALRTDAGDRGAGHLETVRNSIATSMEPAAQQAVMNQLWEQRVSRAIPIVEHPSLRVVHEFFSHYPDDLSTHFPSASKADWKDLQNYVLAQREKRELILAWSQAKEKLKYLKNSLNIPADLDSSLRNADEKEGNIVRAVLNCMKEKAGDFVAAGLVLIDRQKEMSDTEVARLMAEHPAGQLLVIPTHPIMEREYESWRKCLETPLSKPWRKRYLSGVNSCLDKTEDVASVLWSDRELKHAPQPDRAAVELLANFFRAFPEFRGEIASGKNIEGTLTFVSKNLDQYIQRDKKAYENNVRRSEAKTVLDLIEKMRLRPLASQFDALQGMTETLHGSESASQKAPESDDHEERTQAKKFFAMCRKALSSDDTALRIAAMQQNPSVNRNDLASWMVEDKASYVWMCDQLRQSDVKIAAVFEYQHKTMEMLQSPIAETYHSEFLEEIATLCGNTAHRQSLDAKKAEKSIMARFAGRFPNDSEKASLDCMVEMARCLMRDKTLPYPKTADDIEQSRRTMLSMQRTQVIDYFVGTARKHLGKVDTAEAAVNARLDGFSAALNAVKSLSDDNNDVLKMIEAHRARLINSPNKSADYMGRLLTAVTGLFETEVRKTKSESVRDCLVSVGVECIRNFKEPLPKLLKDAQAKEMTRLLKEIEADKSVLPTMAQSERPVPNERAAEVVKTSGSKPATESHQAQHDRLFATLNETQKDVVTKGKFLLAEFGCPATFAAICRHKTLDQNGQLETALIEHRGKTISIEGEARRVMYVTPVHSIKPDDLPTLASLPTTNEEGNNAVTLHLIKPRVLEDTPARTVKLGR
ncbi:MAG TPA: hypothetical protein VM532_14930, partial [Burkholderiales bacterium]|nr:hypothetical protein [Burkholderiales bacterium]